MRVDHSRGGLDSQRVPAGNTGGTGRDPHAVDEKQRLLLGEASGARNNSCDELPGVWELKSITGFRTPKSTSNARSVRATDGSLLDALRARPVPVSSDADDVSRDGSGGLYPPLLLLVSLTTTRST